jgi:hypothetical protein
MEREDWQVDFEVLSFSKIFFSPKERYILHFWGFKFSNSVKLVTYYISGN